MEGMLGELGADFEREDAFRILAAHLDWGWDRSADPLALPFDPALRDRLLGRLTPAELSKIAAMAFGDPDLSEAAAARGRFFPGWSVSEEDFGREPGSAIRASMDDNPGCAPNPHIEAKRRAMSSLATDAARSVAAKALGERWSFERCGMRGWATRMRDMAPLDEFLTSCPPLDSAALCELLGIDAAASAPRLHAREQAAILHGHLAASQDAPAKGALRL